MQRRDKTLRIKTHEQRKARVQYSKHLFSMTTSRARLAVPQSIRYSASPEAGWTQNLGDDQGTMLVVRRNRQLTRVRYLLHVVLAHPLIGTLPSGHHGWIPNGHRSVGIIGLRMEYQQDSILGHDVATLTHKDWIRICKQLRVFTNAMDVLQLPAEVRCLAAWNSYPMSYLHRHIWLRSHAQWLRIHEENPMLRTKTFRLSDVVKAYESDREAQLNAMFRRAFGL